MSTFYVSSTGDDSGDGLTLATAFKTLERAQQAMRDSAGADTALIKGGTYTLNQPLALTGADSNSTFAAYNGEKVTLSAGTKVTGWTKGADGVWTAHVNAADVQQFTVGGVQQIEARYPNYDPTDPIKGGWLWAKDAPAGVDPLLQMAYNKADFAPGQLAAGMKVTVFSDVGYSSDVLTIKSVNTASGVITFEQEATYEIGARSRFFVSDGKVHLDKPGEWWFDKATGTVHFRAPADFDGSGAVAASGDDNLITVNGAQNVTIKGLTFTDAATTAATDDIDTAAIKIVNSSGIIVDGNTFLNVAKGILIEGNSHHNKISGNDFNHLWSMAIDLRPGTHENTISDNSIQHIGEVFRTSGAINMVETWGNLISHNLIKYVPRFGIAENNYDPSNKSGGNIIEYNEILHSGQETPDVAAIYFYSHLDGNHLGAIVRYNKIVDSGGLNTMPGAFVPGQDFSSGIYLDDYTSNAKIYGNFIQGTVFGGVFLHGGVNNDVYNNIIVDTGMFGIHILEIDRAMSGTKIHDNIIQVSGGGENTIDVDLSILGPSAIYANMYYSPTGALPRVGDLSYSQWLAQGGDAGSDVMANPGFANPGAGDYSLLASAFALTQGFLDLPWLLMGLARGGLELTGTAGADQLVGSNLADTFECLAGNDRTIAGAGNDTVYGGAGYDMLIGGAGADNLVGGGDKDTASYMLSTSAVTVNLSAPAGNTGDAAGDTYSSIENLAGTNFSDSLTGSASDNRIRGSAGNDTINGLAGDDMLNGGLGADRLDGGTGADAATYVFAVAGVVASLASPSSNSGEAAGDTYISIENLMGSSFGDMLVGNNADNILYGLSGGDTLDGGSGSDTINGGSGRDVMSGGAGDDMFIFAVTTESGTTDITRDIIADFDNGLDKINLARIDANSGVAGNQAFSAIAEGSFTGVAGQLRYVNAGGNTLVRGDVDGDGIKDFEIQVTGLHALTNADFIL